MVPKGEPEGKLVHGAFRNTQKTTLFTLPVVTHCFIASKPQVNLPMLRFCFLKTNSLSAQSLSNMQACCEQSTQGPQMCGFPFFCHCWFSFSQQMCGWRLEQAAVGLLTCFFLVYVLVCLLACLLVR